MTRRVLDVGQCGPDHAAIAGMIRRHFGAEVDQAEAADDAVEALSSGSYDLVLVNRKLDVDYSDGLKVIERLRSDARLAAVPVMLVTNYQEHQRAAVKAGAVYGFGKAQLNDPEVLRRLEPFLGQRRT